ncbi:hypothetical protein [Nonomuraea guangzhouensis]|uniref:Flagellar M-ring C-terminal domain-containing protein n=1 Tax=Nonomuraea guangzhouensis TaxID=1291555 RepID=A0ABW4GNT9_9ACTN|nr:hypothetical protein [Nonomuraea guangzhouensis]
MAFFLGSPRYKTESSLILTAPPSGGTLSMDPAKPVGLTNPLLQYNDGLRTVAGILILALNSKDELRKLGIAENGSTEIVIDDGRSNADLLGVVTQGPFIHIAVEDPVEATAKAILERAERRLREELTSYQSSLGAPKSTFIAVNNVALIPVEYDGTGKLQLAVEVLVVTLLLGFGGAYLMWVRRLRGRPAPEGPAEDEADDAAPVAIEPEAAKGPALNGRSPAGASAPEGSSADRENDDPPTEEFARITSELLNAGTDPRKSERDNHAG